ncbi:MAG: EAL domain-containing protein, partial [Lachnospiraceae bacterium]|nr:EAL domain-containing protein [Lachnospiraceae bacterium]
MVDQHMKYQRAFMEILEKLSEMSEGQYAYFYDVQTQTFYWARRTKEFFGLKKDVMQGDEAAEVWSRLSLSKLSDQFSTGINQLLNGHSKGISYQMRLRDRSGTMRTCTATVKVLEDFPCDHPILLGMIIDHENTAGVDPVTGLYGQMTMQAQMQYLASVRKPYYLMAIGLRDYFSVNSTYGYNLGNQFLKQIADYGLKLIGERGNFYRADGAKFVFLMPADQGDMMVLERIYNTFRNHLKLGIKYADHRISIDICGGAIFSDDSAIDINSIYTSLQYVLAVSKRENMTELCIFQKEVLAKDNRHLRTLDRIRSAVLNDCEGFYLVYQPIMNAFQDQVTGVEALLRWHDEEFGEVPPNEFISWLEKDPIFFELGNWILRNSMRDMLDLVEQDPSFILNVNIAYSQLQRPEFNTALMKIIREEGFPPQNLCLELTERCRFLDISILQQSIRFWKKLGIRTALDDFG